MGPVAERNDAHVVVRLRHDDHVVAGLQDLMLGVRARAQIGVRIASASVKVALPANCGGRCSGV